MSFLKNNPDIKLLKGICTKKRIEVHLVGGFLRDYCLKQDCVDFDFAVKKDALKIARLFANRIKGAYVPLDEEHGCARVVKKRKGQIYTYDLADYRDKTLLKDLTKRDFTINTLSVDIGKMKETEEIDEVLKDHKKGMKDIKQKRIKQISASAFKDDPLRMMRAFSLKAALNFKIEDKTLKQIKKDRDLIHDVSYERIREELFKVLATPQSSKIIKAMDRYGLLANILPQIKVMFNCKQGGYHHLDVWPHSVETLVQFEKMIDKKCASLEKDNVELFNDLKGYLNTKTGGDRTRLSIIKLACLLHDIGKPDTRKKENNRLSFHGHEHVGKNITKEIAKMLKLSTKERHMLEDMVLWHLRPGYLSNFKRPSKKAVYRYFRDTKDEAVSTILLSVADQRATNGPLTTKKDIAHHEAVNLPLIEEYFGRRKEKPFVRLLNGNDIIKKFKLKPSPLIGKILKEVEEKQMLGKIKTKSEAQKFVKTILEK